MRKFAALLTFLFFITPCFGGVVINEVHPQSPEWVEIYNPNNLTLNLSNWKIKDNSTNKPDEITCYNIENCSLITNSTYFLIIGREINITQVTNQNIKYFYVDDNSIGNGLADKGDRIAFLNSTYSTNFTYTSSGKGKSWCRCPDGGNWTTCENPTPGKVNNCSSYPQEEQKEYAELSIYLKDRIILGISYNSLFKIKIENKNCSEKDNVTIQYIIKNQNRTIKESNFTREVGCSGYANTGEWTPNQTGNYTICGRIVNATTNFTNETICKNVTVVNSKTILCNLSITIQAPLIWYSNKKDNYYIFVNDSFGNYSGYPLEITYWIEDFFGNYIKEPYTSSSIKSNENVSRDYTPKLDCGTEAYIIKANLTKPYCNDINLSDNFAEKIIAVVGDYECEPKIITKVVYKYKTTSSNLEKTKELEIKIINLTKEVARGQEFNTTIELKNNLNKKLSFEIYSYAYKGKDCITGSWTSNKRKVMLNPNEEKLINLTNKIEENAKEGDYNFKVRAKVADKNIDVLDEIYVKGEIKTLQEKNKTIATSLKTEKNISSLNQSINFTKKKEENKSVIVSQQNKTLPTGEFYRENKSSLLDNFLEAIKAIFNYLLTLMQNSIKK